jgi:hypothetical protein
VSPDPALDPLREALRLSPDNVPLRHHLAGLVIVSAAAAPLSRLSLRLRRGRLRPS